MDYTKNSRKNILTWLKANVDEERFSHSIGCAKTAAELAAKFGLDEEKAYLAGLLHDCAKCFNTPKLLELVKEHMPEVDECEISNPKTLHAPASAYVAKTEFGVNDEEILSAIRWHTLGKTNMTKFEKIIFLADKIEPNTRELEYRKMMLNVLETDPELNNALLICYKDTIKSLVARELTICQPTIDIYNWLLTH